MRSASRSSAKAKVEPVPRPTRNPERTRSAAARAAARGTATRGRVFEHRGQRSPGVGRGGVAGHHHLVEGTQEVGGRVGPGIAGPEGGLSLGRHRSIPAMVAVMKAAVSIPVTVKSRIGIDHLDSYEALALFVEQLGAAGCDASI